MIQVYTGNGKGKTTAALGMALRASGAGLKVYLCQFLKGRYYCELLSLKKLKNVRIGQFGKSCFLRKNPTKEDITLARQGLESARKAINKRECDMLILDEINVALKLRLLKLRDITSLIEETPKNIELVLTGRGAHPKIIQKADLVSRIQEKKHYYKKGVKARKGIEY